MIVFENAGTLDVRCIKTMGVHVKETDSAIGFFGTGLKYAIATWLRNNCTVKIITGGTHYVFTAKQENIRGKNFDIVTMNDEELGFTTELGKNWEPWMAYRELYSNMLDEPEGLVTSGRSHPVVKPDRTYIIVQGNAANKTHAERDKYFLDESTREPFWQNCNVQFFEKLTTGSPSSIFYRGIKVGETPGHGQYDYNITSALDLTEDRSLKYSWQAAWEITRAVLRWTKDHVFAKDGEMVVTKIITASLGGFEYSLDFKHTPATPTEDFLEHARYIADESGVQADINPSVLRLLYEQKKRKPHLIKQATLNNIQKAQLERAIDFCKRAVQIEVDEYEIIVRSDFRRGHLGEADMENNIIYISNETFSQGTKRVAVALLEEYTHLKHRVHDETIEQKWVYLEQIITLGEQILGEPI